ncbi:hypothetical protein EVAR_32763_1 [Eumeta japonica]|uniref:Uncharacterized protein n=1 Tax=Eumeta variegata TaxID=151549 RepID=A0A4C1WF48_EUMVA|nr:hypothetical protein EVAR_32763_1 [Eumeta japonica]
MTFRRQASSTLGMTCTPKIRKKVQIGYKETDISRKLKLIAISVDVKRSSFYAARRAAGAGAGRPEGYWFRRASRIIEANEHASHQRIGGHRCPRTLVTPEKSPVRCLPLDRNSINILFLPPSYDREKWKVTVGGKLRGDGGKVGRQNFHLLDEMNYGNCHFTPVFCESVALHGSGRPIHEPQAT